MDNADCVLCSECLCRSVKFLTVYARVSLRDSPSIVSTLSGGIYGRSYGQCLIEVLVLGCGIVPVVST